MAVFYGKELIAGGLDMLAITNQIAELSAFVDSKLNELDMSRQLQPGLTPDWANAMPIQTLSVGTSNGKPVYYTNNVDGWWYANLHATFGTGTALSNQVFAIGNEFDAVDVEQSWSSAGKPAVSFGPNPVYVKAGTDVALIIGSLDSAIKNMQNRTYDVKGLTFVPDASYELDSGVFQSQTVRQTLTSNYVDLSDLDESIVRSQLCQIEVEVTLSQKAGSDGRKVSVYMTKTVGGTSSHIMYNVQTISPEHPLVFRFRTSVDLSRIGRLSFNVGTGSQYVEGRNDASYFNGQHLEMTVTGMTMLTAHAGNDPEEQTEA